LPLVVVLRARERLGGGGALRQLHHDRVWAESIAWQLEADGYQVIVQVLDFTLVVSGPKGCKQRTLRRGSQSGKGALRHQAWIAASQAYGLVEFAT
jgi:hypothetical protein